MSNSSLIYSRSHPVILDGTHSITKIIQSEHLRLMHADPSSSLNQRFHIIGARKVIRSITRQCVICRRHSVKPQNQLLGQLPAERVSPIPPVEKSGVDYAGPLQIKYGLVYQARPLFRPTTFTYSLYTRKKGLAKVSIDYF